MEHTKEQNRKNQSIQEENGVAYVETLFDSDLEEYEWLQEKAKQENNK